MKNRYSKKTIFALLTFTLVNIIFCYGKGKKYDLIYIDNLHINIEKNDYETDSIIVINDSVEIRTLGIFTSDSIYIFTDFPESPSLLYTLKKTGDSLTLFVIEEEQVYDTFIYKFNKSDNSVTVNDNIYYLNKPYYNYLKKKGFEQMNILPLVSLFTRYVEDFTSLFPLIDNMWVNVELAKGSRILRAEIFTQSPHSDMLYSWNISYTYNNLDEITSIRKNYKEDNNLHFDLKLISKSEGSYYYEIFLSDDGGRYSEYIKWHKNKSTLFESTHFERFQAGFSFKYAIKPFLRRKFPIHKFILNSYYLQHYIDRNLKNLDL